MNVLVLIALPFVVFLGILFFLRNHAARAHAAAMVAAAVTLLNCVFMIGPVTRNPGKLSFEENLAWIPYPPIHFHVGLDGLSLWLVFATALISLVAIASAHKLSVDPAKSDKAALFYGWLLLLEAALIGVFTAQDLFLFYVFFELTLVPTLFLMGQWGSDPDAGKNRSSAIQFFIYTFAASILMLGGIIYLFLKAGTFNYQSILAQVAAGSFRLSPAEQLPLFLVFFFAFAVKTPLFPFHAWQANAYSTAPSALGIVMAGLLGKLGTYGLLRFCLPLFPNAAREASYWINGLAIIAIIYGGLVALVQPNIKRLLAFSSLSHLGFIVLGIFSFNHFGLDGASYLMVCHAFTTAALFLMAGYLEERKGSSEIASFGGIATKAPWLATTFLICALASLGLPLLNNFVGEFLILQGAALYSFPYAAGAGLGVILSACYLLWMYQRTFLGPLSSAPVADLSMREVFTLAPLLLMIFYMGIASGNFLPAQSAVNQNILKQSKMNVEFRVLNQPTAKPEAVNGN